MLALVKLLEFWKGWSVTDDVFEWAKKAATDAAKDKAEDRLRRQVGQVFEHFTKKHPKSVLEKGLGTYLPKGTVVIYPNHEDQFIVLRGLVNAMGCAARHGKCPHKAE